MCIRYYLAGSTRAQNYEDMVEAYGDPEETQEEGSGYRNLFYSFTDSNGRKCQVIIGIFDNETTMNPLTRIEYVTVQP